jgi:hypothetical protein
LAVIIQVGQVQPTYWWNQWLADRQRHGQFRLWLRELRPTVESGLCHPLPDLNRHDASFTATRLNHKTMSYFSNQYHHSQGTPTQRPVDKVRSRHRRMHSPQLNFPVECFAVLTRGHGFDSRVGPVMSFLHRELVDKSGVSDNWCHDCWLLNGGLWFGCETKIGSIQIGERMA